MAERRAGVLIGLALGFALMTAAAPSTRPDVERGEYLLHAAGCVTCHTAEADGAIPLAGGRALQTPFGTFHSPNITPDVDTGIGGWSDDDFVRALREGVSPNGSNYYPVFPYPSYSGMSREDALAIKAYLFETDPVAQPNIGHELPWYLDARALLGAWKTLFFSPRPFMPDPDREADWKRGAYLVRHLGHCGECHSPRNLLGAVDRSRELAGNPTGADGKKVPDITPNPTRGIGKWSQDEIEFFLELGMLPNGDFTGGAMAPVVDENTSLLTPEDRRAIAVYLKSLPPSGP